jgi:hypothetical protein
MDQSDRTGETTELVHFFHFKARRLNKTGGHGNTNSKAVREQFTPTAQTASASATALTSRPDVALCFKSRAA